MASNITHLFREGIEDQQYSEILKDPKYARPDNCEGLTVVKLNQLVCPPMPEVLIRNFRTSKKASVLVKTVDKVVKIEKKHSRRQVMMHPLSSPT